QHRRQHPGVGARQASRLEGDQRDERRLEGVVVECAEKLGEKKRAEAPLADQPELAAQASLPFRRRSFRALVCQRQIHTAPTSKARAYAPSAYTDARNGSPSAAASRISAGKGRGATGTIFHLERSSGARFRYSSMDATGAWPKARDEGNCGMRT